MKNPIELYEVKIVNGQQRLFYKGEKLPWIMKTVVKQTVSYSQSKMCEITVTFPAKLVDN